MGKNLIWSADDLKKKGLVQDSKGNYVPIKTLVAKGKVEKLGLMMAVGCQSINLPQNEPTGNKKVRNATKTIVDGIVFDSKLEAHMYTLLRGSGITFERQKEYVLQKPFRYNGEAVRAVKSYVDFWLPTKNILVDCKGWANDIAPLKFKLLKSYLKHIEDNQPEIIMPKNTKECDALLNRLIYNL